MDVVEGTAVYIQYPLVIEDHSMDCTASVYAGSCDNCAVLGQLDGVPMLSWNLDDVADPYCGATSRGELEASGA